MDPLRDTLAWQFRMTWSLARDHWLPALTDHLCLWSVTPSAATIRQGEDGAWRPDWDEAPDPVPPATIGWLTWHIQWWWSETICAVGDEAILGRDAVVWPATAEGIRTELTRLAETWAAVLTSLTTNDLERPVAYPWPEPRPLRMTVAWVNSELMKNTAEIGDVVRLYHAAEQTR